MSEKRRDSLGRILHNGESQLADGRYRYRYTGLDGVRYDVYSWRLQHSDATPPRKKWELSLREKEKQIVLDKFNEIIPNGGKITVKELAEKYVALKTTVRPSTLAGYNTVIRMLENDNFGNLRIDQVNISDAKKYLINLQQKKHKGFSTIKTIRGVLRPAFQMAVEDDLIRKNPFAFEIASIIINDSVAREALDKRQEREFLKFVRDDIHFQRYYDAIFILFKTGMRISEFCGLTISDLDFDKKQIRVDHQLLRTSNMTYYVEEPKTDSGKRLIPMTKEVEEAFRRIVSNRKGVKKEPMIDGYVGFLFLDKNEMPMVALHWEKYFQHIVEKYNRTYVVKMPKVTPHVCRHTYCTNMAKAGMNPKSLQYLMGHSDIAVTLNVYTHFGVEDAREEIERLEKNA